MRIKKIVVVVFSAILNNYDLISHTQNNTLTLHTHTDIPQNIQYPSFSNYFQKTLFKDLSFGLGPLGSCPLCRLYYNVALLL